MCITGSLGVNIVVIVLEDVSEVPQRVLPYKHHQTYETHDSKVVTDFSSDPVSGTILPHLSTYCENCININSVFAVSHYCARGILKCFQYAVVLKPLMFLTMK